MQVTPKRYRLYPSPLLSSVPNTVLTTESALGELKFGVTPLAIMRKKCCCWVLQWNKGEVSSCIYVYKRLDRVACLSVWEAAGSRALGYQSDAFLTTFQGLHCTEHWP